MFDKQAHGWGGCDVLSTQMQAWFMTQGSDRLSVFEAGVTVARRWPDADKIDKPPNEKAREKSTWFMSNDRPRLMHWSAAHKRGN